MKYSDVANQYKKIATNQASAGEQLMHLINFKGDESILDLGCSTGHLTFELSKRTSGRVVGIDASEGMIQQAKQIYGHSIEFLWQPAEAMEFISKFDIVFCNSVLHWFKNPTFVLNKIYTALKPNGIFALQTTVKEWSEFIMDAIAQASKKPLIKKHMDHYKNPWSHLQKASEYQEILETCGFKINMAEDTNVITNNCDLEQIFGLFNSGPALAYLNPENYSIQWDESYKDQFISLLRDAIKNKMGENKVVDISFNRASLIAQKIKKS